MSDIIVNDRTAINRWAYLSAYAIAVKHGFSGTEAEWLASLKGDQGDQGDPGVSLSYQGAYASGTTYAYNDAVTYNGSIYLHVGEDSTTGTDPTDTDVWDKIFDASEASEDIASHVADAQAASEAAAAAQAAAEAAETGAEDAKLAAQTAQTAAEEAQGRAEGAVTDAEAAQDGAEAAQTAAEAAKTAAAASATAASTAEGSARTHAYNAQVAAGTAAGYASGAQTAQTAAETAQAAAEQAESDASDSVGAAAGYAEDSQAWATGYRGSTPVSTGDQYHNNAKYWSDEAKAQKEAAQTAKTGAETAKTGALAAQTAAETAQGKAEDARDLAEQYADSIDPDKLTQTALGAYPTETSSGAIASTAVGADGVPLKALTAQIVPVQAAGTPSPENPLPISGWTGAQIEVAGGNLYDSTKTVVGFYINSSTGAAVQNANYARADYIPVFGGRQYVLAGGGFSGDNLGAWYDANKQYVGGITNATLPAILTAPANARYARFTMGKNYVNNAVFQPGDTVNLNRTTYVEPSIIAVNWQTEAGTVYGGTLAYNGDRTWTLTATHILADVLWGDVTGTAVGTTITRKQFYNAFSAPVVQSGNGCINSVGAPYLAGSTAASVHYYVAGDGLRVNLFLPNETPDTTRIQITGALVTPQVYTISAESIKSLLGTTNVWADCGDVEAVFRCDPTLWGEKLRVSILPMLAFVEGGMTATRNYTAGEYVVASGTFYKLTANVANGGALVEGTNITATTIGAELTALAQA